MKWLIILGLILTLVAMVVYRYRKHIQTGLFMWRTFRKLKQQSKPKQQKQVPERDTSKDSELVSCPKCNKWIAKDDAVKLKSKYYCSLTCLEESIVTRV